MWRAGRNIISMRNRERCVGHRVETTHLIPSVTESCKCHAQSSKGRRASIVETNKTREDRGSACAKLRTGDIKGKRTLCRTTVKKGKPNRGLKPLSRPPAPVWKGRQGVLWIAARGSTRGRGRGNSQRTSCAKGNVQQKSLDSLVQPCDRGDKGTGGLCSIAKSTIPGWCGMEREGGLNQTQTRQEGCAPRERLKK